MLWGFPGGSDGKKYAYECRTILGSGGSLGEGNGNPLQYPCLGNPMDRGAWWATVHRVSKELHMTEQLNSNRCFEGPAASPLAFLPH